jgi:hypothetical protein
MAASLLDLMLVKLVLRTWAGLGHRAWTCLCFQHQQTEFLNPKQSIFLVLLNPTKLQIHTKNQWFTDTPLQVFITEYNGPMGHFLEHNGRVSSKLDGSMIANSPVRAGNMRLSARWNGWEPSGL